MQVFHLQVESYQPRNYHIYEIEHNFAKNYLFQRQCFSIFKIFELFFGKEYVLYYVFQIILKIKFNFFKRDLTITEKKYFNNNNNKTILIQILY